MHGNDLPNAATNLLSVRYADDTNMSASSKDIANLVPRSNLNKRYLQHVSDFLKVNKLSINALTADDQHLMLATVNWWFM